MKKITFTVLLLTFSFSIFAQCQAESKSIYQKHKTDFNLLNTKEDFSIFYWQDFESGSMPPPTWNLTSGTTPQTWKAGTSATYTPISGDYFALCRYDETYLPEGQDEKLFSPVLNLTGLTDAKLSFWFLFSRYWGITPYDNYDLQVLLSTDGGTTFSDTIWTELSTDTASWSSWEWVRADIDLTPYVTETALQLCFRYVGYDGADAAIENVEISFITGLTELQTQPVFFYPNPAYDVLYLDGSGQRTIDVYDLTGRLVFSQFVQDFSPAINIEQLKPGLYSIVISDTQHQTVYTGKIIVE